MDTGTQDTGSETACVGPAVTRHGHLPRLQAEAYRGYAMVHWTMGLLDRKDGWLDETMHARCRELTLHAAINYHFLVPAYCIMPDHIHLLVVGIHPESDQKLGMAFLRRHLNDLLATRYRARLQKQAYDNVLREKDREYGAFQAVAYYILQNPVRAGLVVSAEQWAFSGCLVPGHPGWSVFHAKYWDTFWKHYADLRTTGDDRALAGAATPIARVAARASAWSPLRFGRMALLRPGAEAEYDRLHAAVWPEVLAAIRRAGIRNYGIFRNERQLFSYFEMSDETEPAEITRTLLADPACVRWEEMIKPLQEPSGAGSNEGWLPMTEVFHLP